MKLSKWFSGKTKPALPGYYERDYGIPNLTCDYWDGKRWILVNGDGKHLYEISLLKKWRGLAEDPNKESK